MRAVIEMGDAVQQWEYLQLLIDGKDWSDSAGRSGQFERSKKERLLSRGELLSQLGNEGWELVGTVSQPISDSYDLFFKRPRLVSVVTVGDGEAVAVVEEHAAHAASKRGDKSDKAKDKDPAARASLHLGVASPTANGH